MEPSHRDSNICNVTALIAVAVPVNNVDAMPPVDPALALASLVVAIWLNGRCGVARVCAAPIVPLPARGAAPTRPSG